MSQFKPGARLVFWILFMLGGLSLLFPIPEDANAIKCLWWIGWAIVFCITLATGSYTTDEEQRES